MTGHPKSMTARLLVQCLENEGVQYIFGIPGEENIHFIDALRDSSIRYILTRHEQGASFMADIYGRLTGKAGVCSATLGPGAINLLLGTADATTNSAPLVAISVQEALVRFSEKLTIPVTTTFMGKGVFPDNHPNALGTVGFMRRDYVNFGFDQADVVLCVGYELQEFSPAQINPSADKQIIHIHTFPAEVDDHYTLAVGIEGNIALTLDELAQQLAPKPSLTATGQKIRAVLQEEREKGARDASFPVKPQRLVADIRAALGDSDIVLADTGAVKMWMARLYPAYQPNTCLVSNGLSTMAFTLPGAIAAKLAYPDRKILAVMGDGSFLMNAQELETAIRERTPFVVLVWVDDSYGLIEWKMDLELGRHSHVTFTNPDFVRFAESFGAKGYRIQSAEELLPTLKRALADDVVSVIACPVDSSENIKLTDKLGKLTEPI